MWSTNSINLRLKSESVLLHGTKESAPGQIVRGSVVLNIENQTKILSIVVTFKGFAATLNSKQNNGIFYQKEVEFLCAVNVAKDFLPGQYTYNFEIPFSGGLPESMHSSLSHITYTMTTVAKRGGLAKNLKTKREIKVLRLSLSASQVQESPSLVRFGELKSELAFCIFSPSIIYSLDDDIPIQIGVDSLKTDMKVNAIQATIYEVIKCSTPGGKLKCKRSKIRKAYSNGNTKSSGQMRIQRIVLSANKESKKILSDRENDYVCVQHELNIIITLIKGENIRKRVIIRTSLQFVDSEALNIARSLPCYEQSLEVPPCYNNLVTYSYRLEA